MGLASCTIAEKEEDENVTQSSSTLLDYFNETFC